MSRYHVEPRKQPSQSRARATVAAILEAAAHILEEQGYAAFNTNAVAARAGASVGSLYQYFPNKDALLGALVHENANARFAAIQEAAMTRAAPDDVLRAIIRAAVENQLKRPQLGRILDEAEARLPLEEDLAADRGRLLAVVILVLQRHPVSFADPQGAAIDLFGIVRGMSDASGSQGLTADGIDRLSRRIEYAIFGYLDNHPRAS